ncbi:MAG: hypothetical protein Fur0037_11050 [Planctomycetota bacterium]
MRNVLERPGEAPVTLALALAYVTCAFLTGPVEPDPERLFAYGMLRPLDAASGEPWRLLSCAFLHGGIVHLGFNTFALAWIGPMIEKSIGSARFALLYAVSALGGSIAFCLWNAPWQSVVGGSGALFGMMGSAVALNMRAGRHIFSFLAYEGPRALLSLIAVNLVLGWMMPMVSNTCHIGGLLSGFLLTFFFLQGPREGVTTRGAALRAAIALLFVSCAAYCIRPVARWDWLLSAWHEADPGPARDALKRAYMLSAAGDPDAEASEEDLEADFRELQKIRSTYRR